MLKKWLRNIHCNRGRQIIPQREHLSESEIKKVLCLFSVSTENKNHLVIKLNENESSDDEEEADKLFRNKVNEGDKYIDYYNYRSGWYQKYNKRTGGIIKLHIRSVTPVDLDSLYATIGLLSSEFDNCQLPPKYFSIIFKLLKDKILGTGYSDLKATTFRQTIVKDYKTEGRSSFSKYQPHGIYPDWYYDEAQFKRDKEKNITEAIDFAEKFKRKYDEIRLEKANLEKEINKTAEEIAE